MCGGLQIRQNGEDETETLKRRSRNGGRRNGALFVFIRPPFPATVPCGVADCTFRKVFEYSAESTRVLAAEYAAGLRTALRYFAQGRTPPSTFMEAPATTRQNQPPGCSLESTCLHNPHPGTIPAEQAPVLRPHAFPKTRLGEPVLL